MPENIDTVECVICSGAGKILPLLGGEVFYCILCGCLHDSEGNVYQVFTLAD